MDTDQSPGVLTPEAMAMQSWADVKMLQEDWEPEDQEVQGQYLFLMGKKKSFGSY